MEASLVAILSLGFFLGLKHATDADHVVAVTTFVSRERSVLRSCWIGAFWGPALEAPESAPHEVGRIGGPLLMIVPTVALAVLSLGIAVAAGPLYELAQRTAVDLLDPSAYRQAVLR